MFYKNIKSSFNKLKFDGFPRARFFDGEDKVETATSTPSPVLAPEFPEAKAARESSWNYLQDWGKSGTWGLNLPDYDKIYKAAADKVSRYYWGGANTPGVIDKIRASASRRNVTDSPVADIMTGRMAAEESDKLGELSAGLEGTRADALERARTNWMNSMLSLSTQKPEVQWANKVERREPQESLLPQLIGAGVGLAGQYMMGSAIGKGFGQTTPSSITGGGSSGDDLYDLMDMYDMGGF